MDSEAAGNKFVWNATIKVSKSASSRFHPGEIASVCGMEKIQFEDVAQQYSTKVGNWVYTIEFNDGSDITIPEEQLERFIT